MSHRGPWIFLAVLFLILSLSYSPTDAQFTCSSGQYYSSVSGSCISCPTGYYSFGGNVTSCTPCMAGRYCATASTSGTACPAGQYSLGAQTACTACPAGYRCFADAPPARCPQGTYAAAGASSCTTCPAGRDCSDPAYATPPNCAAGFYSLSGFSQCQRCPAGFSCSSASSNPVACTAGTYSPSGSTACTNCEAGFACPTTTDESRYACSPGSYSTGSASACTICPAGSACPSTSVATVTACAAGSYSLGGQVSCTPCPAGYACASANGQDNRLCLPGTFSGGSATSCSSCAAGYYCPYTTVSNGGATVCPPGSFSSSGAARCSPCRAGYQCPAPYTSEIACTAGTYSSPNATTCTVCPKGFYCPKTDEPLVLSCPLGTYNDQTGRTVCTICPAGSSCLDPTATPVACSSGTYSPEGVISCEDCPAGHACSNAGRRPVMCDAGYYAPARSTNCTQCAAGYYCPSGIRASTSTPAGFACPAGYYCALGTGIPVQCGAGRYNPSQGGSSVAACLLCPAGYNCAAGTGVLTATALCPRGYYCDGTTGTSTACPAGSYSETLGATSAATCLPCPAGRYCASASSTNGIVCPVGQYCPDSSGSGTNCPAGKYGGTGIMGLKSVDECKDCPAGSYCPAGSQTPTPCPLGTYRPLANGTSSASCTGCPAGYACSTTGLVSGTEYTCSPGYYCPTGTSNPTANPCPAGSWSDNPYLTRQQDCEICWEGHYCLSGSTSMKIYDCPAGYYCPGAPLPFNGTRYYYGSSGFLSRTSTATQFPCPAGTYSNRTNLRSLSECTACTAGWACTVAGLTAPNVACVAGYYCPEGSYATTSYPCPAGTYSSSTGLFASSQCLVTPPGYYSGAGATTISPCAPGSYTDVNGTVTGNCKACPAGYYCTSATSVPMECGKGKYSGPSASSCSNCIAGSYCPDAATAQTDMSLVYLCQRGLWCPGSVPRIPELYTYPCPSGFYCPHATTSPISCPAGTYNPSPGREKVEDCTTCPAGWFCAGGNSTLSGECSPGYYCPAGSSNSTAYACPARYYRDQPRGEKVDDCAVCQRGKYCKAATVTPSACDRGFYCVVGVSDPEPCPLGTYGNSTGLRSSAECTPCTPGYYCDGLGLPAPRGKCDPGYYCLEGSYTSAPLALPYGGVCPPGGYCPSGSSFPSPCSPGTFNNFTGGRAQIDCSACLPGYYCAGSSNPQPTAKCSPGYYCTGSAVTPIQYATPAGYYTVEGDAAPRPCPQGTYQPDSVQGSCLQCDEGFYCPNTTMTTTVRCDIGHYCPMGSKQPTPCPAGTYRNLDNGRNVSSCFGCPAGQYCASSGLTAPIGSGYCAAGYYCPGGQATPTPADYICPVGKYCVNGTINPVDCPVGTYRNTPGAQSVVDCLSCSPGNYCNGTGLVYPSSNCTAGYYCSSGSTTPTPTDGTKGNICPVGSYCPAGASSPIACPDGTFSFSQGAASCQACPAGYYCASGSANGTVCPSGYYCPASTGLSGPTAFSLFKCPVGSFSSATGLTNVSQCTRCTGGVYCGSAGLTAAPATQCAAGVYCQSGASTSTGSVGILGGDAGACPTGYYCPSGTVSPIPCPVGTFNPSLSRWDVSSHCLLCTGGRYCNVTGSATVSGLCSAGFYCPSGSNNTDPMPSTTSCPVGSYCPMGSSSPINCPAGSYQDQTQQSSCKTCPAGYYCIAGTSTPTDCPAGFYCPANTTSAVSNPCPQGTYSNATNRVSMSQCISCPAGKFCPSLGQTSAVLNCSAGYLCISGASTGSPVDGITGRACQAGYFCPSGVVEMVECPSGYFCGTSALSLPSGPCDAGYYCGNGSSNRQQFSCPAGYYCNSGSSVPAACPPGTYAPSTRNANISACLSCVAGQYCSGYGLSSPSGQCLAGYYCPQGSTISNQTVCTTGHYCPVGSSAPQPCASGTYQSLSGQSSCGNCPAQFYCDASDACSGPGIAVPRLCPAGYYCPGSVGNPTSYPCPVGTFSNATGLQSAAQCTDCTVGQFCATLGLTKPSGMCSPGYYCFNRSSVATPVDGIQGAICPTGSYCVSGSASPALCPAGTYNPVVGGANMTACLKCAAGSFCNGTGQAVSSSGLCSPGFACFGGSTVPTPMDNVTGSECPAGTYCTVGSVSFMPCSPGYYNPYPRRDSCDPCPAGRLCDVSRMIDSNPCKAGHYCPGTTSVPLPCPLGSYSNSTSLTSVSQCTICPAGTFCNGTGLSAPLGYCAAGYYCSAGSAAVNALCPRGYYCPQGTPSPVLCPSGTYSNASGLALATDCTPCAQGNVCTSPGLTAPDAICQAGYYCPSPASSVATVVCPKGSFCPSKSEYPTGCPGGYYQDTVSSTSCKVCPIGYYCFGNSSSPSICPVGYYCPSLSTLPYECPNGTYGNMTGLQSASDCTVCPAGKYCSAGVIQGPCSAGFVCYSGSAVPAPLYNDTRGGICPLGHYCLAGTTTPTPCSNSTVNPLLGGATASACVPCPAGYRCVPGNPVPTPCSPGYYCELNSAPAACPARTYLDTYGGTDASACKPCPDSYYCPDTAMTTFTLYPCPAGHYCYNASITPSKCPVGTFRSSTLGGNPSVSCSPCTPGYYCPSAGLLNPLPCPSKYYCPQGTSTPIPCTAGGYCPGGSSNVTVCPAGFFCSNSTDSPTMCPAGFYCTTGATNVILCGAGTFCPNGTGPTPIQCPAGYYCPLGATSPVTCPLGAYCPSGSASPALCPLGTYGVPGVSVRNSSSFACSACPAGTHGAKADRTSCDVCTAGYICVGGTTSATPTDELLQKGRRCREGTYCPAGSSVETPCPVGTYNRIPGAASVDSCLSCPANSYTASTGSAMCLPCGASATSKPGSSTCECVGRNRQFLPTSGTCLCKPYYVFYDGNLKRRDEDSTLDCVPRVYDDCNKYESTRFALDGSCQKDDTVCASICTSGSGKLDRNTGMCNCDQTAEADDVCDATCRSSQPTIVYDSVKNEFAAVFANGTKVTYSGSRMPGKFSCPHDGTSSMNCSFRTVQSTSTGARGVLVPGDSFLSSLLGKPLTSLASSSVRAVDGRSADVSAVASPPHNISALNHLAQASLRSSVSLQPGLDSPIVCVNVGDGIVWSISSSTNYPVYVPDSLLNNAPSGFDYGAFLELADRMKSGASTVSSFAFTFVSSGTYTFSDAANSNRLTMVVVLPTSKSCPSSSVMAATSQNAAAVGITRNDSITTPPNWIFIGVILAGVVLLIGVTVAACFYVRRSKSADSEYKRLGDDFLVATSKAAPVDAKDEEAGMLQSEDRSTQLLEDFNVKTFYDKLEDSTIHMMSQIANSNLQGLQMYRNILDETERIKNILSTQLHASKDDGEKNAGDNKKAIQLDLPQSFTDAMSAFLKKQLDDMGIVAAHQKGMRQRNASTPGSRTPRSFLDSDADETDVFAATADDEDNEFLDGDNASAGGRRRARVRPGSAKPSSAPRKRSASFYRRVSSGGASVDSTGSAVDSPSHFGSQTLSSALYDEEEVAYEDIDADALDMESVLSTHYHRDFADWFSDSAPPEKEMQVLDLERRLAQRRRRLEKRQMAEKADLEAQIDFEEREMNEGLQRQLDAQKQTVLAHLEDEMELLRSRLHTAGVPEKDIERESEALAREHAQVLADLEEEARKSKMSLSQRFSKRRSGRIAVLQEQHDEEADVDHRNAAAERDDLARFLMAIPSTSGVSEEEAERKRWDAQRRMLEDRIVQRKRRREQELQKSLDRVQMEGSEEEDVALSLAELQMDRQSEIQVQILEQQRNADLQNARSEGDRRRIMDEYAREFEELESAMEYEKERQLQLVRERLESQKRKKEAHVRRRHAEMVEADLVEDRKALDDLLSASMGAVQRMLTTENADVLASRLEEEEKRLRSRAQDRVDSGVQERSQKMRQEMEHALAAVEQQFTQKQRSRGSSSASALDAEKDAERARIIADFEQGLKELEAQADLEKRRQLERIEKKMAAQRSKIAAKRKKELEEQELKIHASVPVESDVPDASSSKGASDVVSSDVQKLVEALAVSTHASDNQGTAELSDEVPVMPLFDGASTVMTSISDLERDAELDAWFDMEMDAVDADIGRLRRVEQQSLKTLYGSLSRATDDEAEKQRLMDAYSAEVLSLNDRLDAERLRQRSLLQDRLAGRRAILAAKCGAGPAAEAANLMRELEDNVAAAMQQGESQLADYLDKLRKKEMAKRTKKRDDALAGAKDDSTRAAIMAQYDADVHALEKSLDVERSRQRAKLSDKLSQRRAQLLLKQATKSSTLKEYADSALCSDDQAALQQSEQSEIADVEQLLARERSRRLAALVSQRNMMLRDCPPGDPARVAAILEQHEHELGQLEDELDRERRAQLGRVSQAMAARRLLRMANGLGQSARDDKQSASDEDACVAADSEAEAVAAIDSGIRKQGAQRTEALKAQRDSRLDSAASDAERARILREYDQEVEQLADGLERERLVQLELLSKKKNARKGRSKGGMDSLDREETSLRSDVEAQLVKKRAYQVEQLRKARDAALHGAQDDLATQQRIMAEYDADCIKIEDALANERARQMSQLTEVMMKRRANAERIARRIASTADNDIESFSHDATVTQYDEEEQSLSTSIVDALVRAEEASSMAALTAEFEGRRRSKLDILRQNLQESLMSASSEDERARILDVFSKEANALEESIDVERARQEAAMNASMAKRRAELLVRQERARADLQSSYVADSVRSTLQGQRDLAIEKERNTLDHKLKAASTEDEKGRIMREYEEAVAKIDNEMDVEKDRQLAKLREKLQAKKDKLRTAQAQDRLNNPGASNEGQQLLMALAVKEEAALAAVRVEQLNAAQVARENAETEAKLRAAQNDNERDRLLSEHAKNIETLEASLDSEKAKQKELIAAAMAQRRAQKEKSQRVNVEAELRKQSERRLEEEKQAELVRKRKAVEEKSKLVNSADERDRLMKEFQDEVVALEQQVEEEKERQRTAIAEKVAARKAKAEAKQRALDDTLQQEIQRQKQLEEMAAKERSAAEERKKLAAAKREALAAAVDPNLVKAQAAEMSSLMAEHDAEASQLSSTLGAEEERQRAEVQRRLAEKKKRKQDALSKKHAAETALAMEKKALLEAIQQGKVPPEKAREVVRATLQRRHEREMADLQAEHDSQLRAKVDELESQSAPADKIRAAKEWLDMQHAEERLSLRQRHSKELTQAVAECDPLAQMEEKFLSEQEAQRRAREEEAAKRASEIAQLQKSVEREREEMRRAAAEERSRIEEEQKEAIQREMATLDAELSAERNRMERALEEERNRRLQAMELLRQQKEREKEEELAMRTELQEEQKKQLLESHQKEITTLIGAMDAERAKQEELTKRKLLEKQEVRRKRKQKDLDQQNAMDRALERERDISRHRLEREAEKEWKSKLVRQESTVRMALTKLRKNLPTRPTSPTGSSETATGSDVPKLTSQPSSSSLAVPGRSTVFMTSPQSLETVTKFFNLPPEEVFYDLLRRSPLFAKLSAVDDKLSSLLHAWEQLRQAESTSDVETEKIIADIRKHLQMIMPGT